ncbi:unnamed protein product [Ceratitis capitata]|uniref:(Mediterranean fruit fly) hypothetical protein n=1 Tax=Ceratitis capitata TaxID=7213 RepID=A0A811VCS8_CERCA|nr:unnamed protein product [Ceratitis capitata]
MAQQPPPPTKRKRTKHKQGLETMKTGVYTTFIGLFAGATHIFGAFRAQKKSSIVMAFAGKQIMQPFSQAQDQLVYIWVTSFCVYVCR